MTEERVVETQSPAGQRHTHTTIVTSEPPRRRGTGTVILLILATIVVIAAIWALTNMGGAEIAKDNAVADAAGEVGAAASEVGDAARNAAGAIAN